MRKISMGTRTFAALVATLISGTVSLAQTPDPLAIPAGPAEDRTNSAGGVDFRTGQYSYSATDLAGSGPGGLSFARNSGSTDFTTWQPMGQFSHNWHIYITYKPIKNGQASFGVGGARGQQFVATNSNSFSTGTLDYTAGLSAVATGSGALDRYFVYSNKSGEKITFRPQSSTSDGATRRQTLGASGQIGDGISFYASKIEQQDGTVYTLTYDEPTSSTPAFLRRVTSNAGYVLILEWVTNPIEKFISKACLFNAAVETVPTANSCATATQVVSYGYGSNGFMTSATDVAGVTSTYASTYSESGWQAAINSGPDPSYFWTEKYFFPGESTPYLTNTMFRNMYVEYVASQDFAVGADYTYSWGILEHNEWTMEVAGGVATRSDGKTHSVSYQVMWRPYSNYPDAKMVSSGPWWITDELGRQLKSNYCTGGGPGGGCELTWLKYWEYPEGNKTTYTYNSTGRPVTITQNPKPGSSESPITTSYTYFCTGFRCAPSQITDGNGNVTNATYSTVHGGMLTKTLPADANGIRPQTRYSYAQKYPWLKSGSTYVQSTTPIWMLVSEEFCKTSAADSNGNCAAGSSDEVVTTYEYEQGSSTKGSNLRLLGTAVTANGVTLRTCQTYDKWGRVLSATEPKAGLTSCQ